MSSTQHQLIEQCATRLRGIVEALDNIHDTSPHRWSTDLDDVHSSAESLLALIKDQAPALDAQDLALRTIAEYPCPEQDNMTAANMRQVAADAITGALAFGAQASQPPAEDHWLRPFYDIGRAEGQRTQELAMLVRMLASSLKRHAPESNLVARATNYLAAKGLAGTPLRDAPASVEQAGGDERAACNLWIAEQQLCQGSDISLFKLERNGALVSLHDLLRDAYQAGQARAALAQPSPKREQRLVECDACPTSGGCVEKCMKAPTQPSPAQTQPSPAPTLRAAIDVANARFEVPVAKWGTNLVGEEEQPEVVARVDGTDEDWFIQPEDETELHNEGLLFAGCELGRMIDFDRIVGALRDELEAERKRVNIYVNNNRIRQDNERLRAERRDALARVAGLESGIARIAGDFLPDNSGQAELALGEMRQALHELLATPVAQAQHSVPQAWLDVQAERRRQIEAEGWTPEHDDEHSHGQMARASACYALAGSSAPNDGTAALLVSLAWPWDEQWWKPSTARRDLVKACALALAEIERLDRATATQGGPRDA
ncbi:hypothetical protein L4Z93_005370 [Pseudomonas aeruginosa]